MATVERKGARLIVTTEFTNPPTVLTVSKDGTVTKPGGVTSGDVLLVIRTLTDNGYREAAAAVKQWWKS